MARANIARRQGDDFQARLFWLSASYLLEPRGPIAKVAYESGPKGFDDIRIEYDPKAAPPDHEGSPLYRRYIQCKGHTTAGTFWHADLIDPAFINAESCSLLQRVRHAQSTYAPDGLGCRFELKTNWRILPDDPLIQLVRKESDAIDNARLFDGTTDRSRMGQVRKLWCDHLHLDEKELSLMTRTLAIVETTESLAALRERLDERFGAVGLRRVPASETSFLYDDLVFKLLAQGRLEFDKDSFRAMCLRENLLQDPCLPPDALTIGIRSFMHPIDNLEDRCERMLNLVPYFEGRYIRDTSDWQKAILPQIRNFLTNAAQSTDHLRLILDAHVSMAFLAGSILNVKSGKQIEIEQRTAGRRFWSLNDTPADSSWPNLLFDQEFLHNKGDEIAIAASLTHEVSPDVRKHFTNHRAQIGSILHCRPETGPSQQAVRCGHHASKLAEALSQRVHGQRASGQPIRRVHIFIAAPNGFTFFLGQYQQILGSATLYEWDFENQRGGGYKQSLSIGP